MRKVLAYLQKAENFIVITSFIVMVIASFSQVVNRNFLGIGISWFEELARYCMIYMALLATEMGLRDGTQISVTMFIDKLHPRAREVAVIVAKVIVIAFTATVFYTSLVLLEKQIMSGQTSSGLGIPMYIPYFALPLSFALMAVVQTVSTLNLILNFGKRRTDEGGVIL